MTVSRGTDWEQGSSGGELLERHSQAIENRPYITASGAGLCAGMQGTAVTNAMPFKRSLLLTMQVGSPHLRQGCCDTPP